MSGVDTPYARAALQANDSTFSLDALESARVNTFDRILTAYGRQAGVQRNQETPRATGVSPDGTHTLYLSRTGFLRLPFPAAPRLLYVEEGNGATSRPAEVVEDGQVDQVVLHSFGYSIDLAAVRAGARSIQVDSPESGHNPFKVYNRLQQVLFQPNQASTHLITRRGDIISACPWNRAPAVNRSRQLAAQFPERRSISIELEAWHTTFKLDFDRESNFRILNLMPYTAAQLISLAFILKKLGMWSGANMANVIGFTATDAREKLGDATNHVAGIIPASAYLGPNAGPGGEFLLPSAWRLGDPLPAHLEPQRALWDQRQDAYYRQGAGFAEGSIISHFTQLEDLYAQTVPDFDLGTEVFEQRDEQIFAAARTGDGLGSPAEGAILSAGEGYARASSMQSTQRAGLYAAAPMAVDAVVTAAAEAHARRVAAAFTAPVIPVVRKAVSFNFQTGQWVVTNVVTQPPVAAAPTAPGEQTPAQRAATNAANARRATAALAGRPTSASGTDADFETNFNVNNPQ